MPDRLTKEERHKCMASVRAKDTRPELSLRRSLWRKGFRYRVNDKRLPGSPDIVLPKYKTVIFVNGCFWHGHQGCKSFRVPSSNSDFWTTKIGRNKERDQEVWRQLEARGWSVIVVWECELKKSLMENTVGNVVSTIRKNGDAFHYQQAVRKEARALYLEERRQQKEREQSLRDEINLKFPH